MPGVPSGRACEGCRKQRKKCDEGRPSCSRCIRLRMVCVGSGQQRYLFKEQQGFQSKPNKGQGAGINTSLRKRDAIGGVPRSPNNELIWLANSFIDTIKASTSLRYNLAWTYGGFLEDIPRRLGTNEALDTAVRALLSGHASLCLHREVSIEALTKYSHALQKLRVYLDDPIKACASETLCAVMLLMMCQACIGVTNSRWTGHCEGVAQILKARRYYDVQDDFECKILLSLRGPVLFEGLFNKKILFSPWEWRTLVENKFDGVTPEGQMMRCLARLPDFMQRGRRICRGEGQDPELLHETRINYETLKTVLEGLRGRLAAVQNLASTGPPELTPGSQIHAHYQRSYALGLAIGIILSGMLSAIDTEDTGLNLESTAFSKEIIALAEPAAIYRPLGASYMGLCLMAAWIGTTDCSTRSLAESALADYRGDFLHGQSTTPTEVLEQFYERLHLLDLDLIDNSIDGNQ